MSQARPSSGRARNIFKGMRTSSLSKGSEGGCSAKRRIIESNTGRSRDLTSAKFAGGALFTTLLNQFRHQTRPACLVTRANSGAIVSMKIFMEQKQILPMWIVVENLRTTRRWTAAIVPAKKSADQAARNLARQLPQIRVLAGTRRALPFEILAIVM